MSTPITRSLHVLEQQMQLELARVRQALDHGGNKGSSLESTLRNFLRSYLPASNKVGHGEAIDSFGSQSGQLDVIISNIHHPPMNLQEQPSPHFIEGVSAAGEVKACLRHSDIDSIFQSCVRFKNLKPHHQLGSEVRSNPEDIERFVESRPYFVFGFDSEIRLSTLKQKMIDHYASNNTPIDEQVDGVFLLGHGSIINYGKGSGNLKLKIGNLSIPGIHAFPTDLVGVLSFLLAWYSLVTPEVKLLSNPILRYLLPNEISAT